ncbi:hypothetical protein D6827_03410 [Candidatus Parcubacteria bacterium]|nr:MAG: hypothetical protein D6827_03410 [Candidatus Parcubacteria bacterium]
MQHGYWNGNYFLNYWNIDYWYETFQAGNVKLQFKAEHVSTFEAYAETFAFNAGNKSVTFESAGKPFLFNSAGVFTQEASVTDITFKARPRMYITDAKPRKFAFASDALKTFDKVFKFIFKSRARKYEH